jgi:hypothetical protein
MDSVVRNFARMAPNSGRNAALNGAAWTLGHWVAAGALDQVAVEDTLYGAAEQNGLVADDGARQCWATICSGLSTGLLQPKDLDADERPPRGRRSRRRRGPNRRAQGMTWLLLAVILAGVAVLARDWSRTWRPQWAVSTV